MRAFLLLAACADAFTSTHSFEALPAPRGEPTTDDRCMSVCYTDDARTVNRWLRDNAAGAAAVGFDTETACAFAGRKPPAPGPHVLQLAAGDACLVAHLVSGDVCASGALADVLSDHTIAKVGVGLDDDAVELYNIDSRMKLSGRLDIGGPRKGRRIALREVAHRCIGGPIAPKAKKIACSNWAMRRLQSKQLAYAARDAWLGAAVYGALAADPSFVEATAAQIHGEMKIDELSALAADRRVIKRKLKMFDEDDADGFATTARELSQNALSALQQLSQEQAAPILDDLASKGADVRNPSAYVVKAVANAIRRELKKFPRPDPRLDLEIAAFADNVKT